MCGIVYLSIKNASKDLIRRQLGRGLAAIRHRGPDSQGMWFDDGPDDSRIGIGHVRLSILDQSSAGCQPMVSADGKIVMAFNGEIYNFNDIRGKIDLDRFKSTGDSEVLLEGYSQHQIEWFQHLRGMFAAIFYDTTTKDVVIVRDQLGVKPVYYYENENTFAACSEIKGLKAMVPEIGNVCKNSLFEFLSCGFVFEPDTGIEGVKKVPPGSFLKIKNGVAKISQYFDINTETKISRPVIRGIKDAIVAQTNADAKIGVFFSGGLDSTVIASTVRLPCLFAKYGSSVTPNIPSTGDEDAVDLIKKHLQLSVEKVQITDKLDTSEKIIDSIKEVVNGNEELISDYTFYASKAISSAAKERGFKVMLSGMGGDESFIGYPRYKVLIQNKKYKILNNIIKIIKKCGFLKGNRDVATKSDRLNGYFNENEFATAYSRLLGYLSREELIGLIGDQEYKLRSQQFNNKCGRFIKFMSEESRISKAVILDYYGFLSHNLMVADKSSMSAGVELRVPLLDQDLYCENVAKMRSKSESFKFGKDPIKKLLKNSLGTKVLNRKKVGFNPPLDGMIEQLGKTKIKEIVLNAAMLEIVNKQALEDLVDAHFAGRKYNALKLWQMLYLSFWLTENRLGS